MGGGGGVVCHQRIGVHTAEIECIIESPSTGRYGYLMENSSIAGLYSHFISYRTTKGAAFFRDRIGGERGCFSIHCTEHQTNFFFSQGIVYSLSTAQFYSVNYECKLFLSIREYLLNMYVVKEPQKDTRTPMEKKDETI
jgi:hypothetical protein